MMMLALAVSSCKDDDTAGDGSGDGNGDGNGNPGVVDDDYFPREMGNTWNYSDDSTVEVVDREDDYYEVTNFGPISGVSLSIAEDLTVNKIAVKKDDGDYWIKAEIAVLELPGIVDGTAEPIEYIILKDDASVGTSWISDLVYSYSYANPIPGLPPIVIPPVTIPYTFEIIEKDMTLDVGTRTFEDVIHVNQRFENLIGGLVSTDIYYAEGVGVIRYQTTDGVTSSTDLTSYDLN